MGIAKWIVAAAVAATAMAGDQPKIQVCTSSTVQTGPDLPRAQQIAHTIFEQAGVEIQWVSLKACGADAIRIKVQGNTPEGDHGKAYAYALPYEGHTIVVLYDRIVQGNGRSAAARVLAHVLNLVVVLFAADRALDEGDVHHLWKVLVVNQGAVDQVGQRGHV